MRALLTTLMFMPLAAHADAPRVIDVTHQGSTFHVTVRHGDTGWDHYADRFEILDTDGNILATRTLFHPHVDEQPFTRSQPGVKLPPGTKTVDVRAHDKVHGYGPVFRYNLN